MVRKLALLVAVVMMLVGAHAPAPASSQVAPPAFTATDCPEITDSIVRLYSAYFLRAPDQAGFDFWVDQTMTGGHNLDSMSDFFSVSDEFVATYGTLTNDQFVDLIYQNILGRPGEPEGRAFWLDQLNTGARTRGNVMINFSEGPEYVARSQTFTPLAGFFNWYPPGTTYQCGTGNTTVTLETNRYYDVGLSNYAVADRSYDVDFGIPRQGFQAGVIAPLFTQGFFNLDPISSRSTMPLYIEVDVDIAWMVVSSPSPLPETRSGWDTGAAPMGG